MLGFGIYDACQWAGLVKSKKHKENGKTYQGITFLPEHFDEATALGELFTGAALWGSLTLSVAIWPRPAYF